jgi:hypothetical protein
MAHLIYVKSKQPKKFSYCKFGTYTRKNGKKSVLLNPDDLAVDGWEMYDPLTTLDIDNEYDKRIYDFLLEHPFMTSGKTYEMIDTKANIEKQAASILEAAEAVQVATAIKDIELNDLRRLFGIGEDFEDKIVKAKLIQMAGRAPAKFLEIYNDADKDYKVFLKNALAKKVIQKVNDVWKHGNYTLGISDGHAIQWLKENPDIYATMKNQVRNGIKKTEEVKTNTSDMVASAGIQDLERRIESDNNKKWFDRSKNK